MLKSNGPRMLPCGKPELTGSLVDRVVLKRGLYGITLDFSKMYSGTKVGTESQHAHNFCKLRAVHCFVLAAKLMFRNGVTTYTVTYRVLKVRTQHHYVPVPRLGF